MKRIITIVLALVGIVSARGQGEERLNRGVVGVETKYGVFLSWRLLKTDSEKTAFDVYRDGYKLNEKPLTNVTCYTDPAGSYANKYEIRTIDGASGKETRDAAGNVWKGALWIHLDKPKGGQGKDGRKYFYGQNDCTVADVDGDGEYEIIVKWEPSNAHDNSHNGETAPVLFDCYKMNGQKLWRIDLGQNIRAGAHYTQFLAYDLDGDGKAEFGCKTAPGSKDGKGKYVSEAGDNKKVKKVDNSARFANDNGHIMKGEEFFTIFRGETGEAIHTVFYEPGRDIRTADKDGWGDNHANRSERYLATVAYLPNKKGKATPSFVMCRGYYTHAFLTAWQFDGKKLKKVWMYETPSANPKESIYGAGAHSVMASDVDGDGYDEIMYGAAAVDHDGKMLYNTGWGHGDALHVGDMDPDRPGLEVWMPHESAHHAGKTLDGERIDYGVELHDAKTGEIIWCKPSAFDNGRGLAADIDSTYRGYEMWSLESKNVYNVSGKVINEGVGELPPVNFRVYWDGDLQDELFDGGALNFNFGNRFRGPFRQGAGAGADSTNQRFNFDVNMLKRGPSAHADSIQPRDPNDMASVEKKPGMSYVYKWDSSEKKAKVLTELKGMTANGTKRTPNFLGDIIGDWREEIVLWEGDDLVIYTTTIPTQYRVVTLTQDRQYRMNLSSQNAAYNQPPHISYYLPSLFGKK